MGSGGIGIVSFPSSPLPTPHSPLPTPYSPPPLPIPVHARHPLSLRDFARRWLRGRWRRGDIFRGRGGAYLRGGLAQSLRQIERDRFINPQFAGITFGLDGATQEFREITKQQHIAELSAAAHLIDDGQKLLDHAGQVFSFHSLPPSFVITPGLNVGHGADEPSERRGERIPQRVPGPGRNVV